MGELKTFETLACYIKGRELRHALSRFCKTLPKEEEYRLKDQIVRASRSVTANLAEGYGRHHHQENIQFCRIARGSLSETLDHLNTALDEEYLSDKDYGELRSMLSDTWKVLNGFIAYLKKCAADGVPGSE
ncbi:MAG: four helix bundle protein [Kiritimatiellae bacterium]|jgi:four helix bundle protein|nr:four helix bundle protein [Kiritimatiellia bacterium]